MSLIGNISMVRIPSNRPGDMQTFFSDTLEVPLDYADDNIAIFDTGSCKISFEQADADEAPVRTGFAGISFETTDIKTAVETLRQRGVEIVGEPAQQYWGGTLAHFNDPEGRTFTLVQYPETNA